jgi:uncharacterized protein YcaQ
MNSSHDTGNIIVEKEKELSESLIAQRAVGQAIYEISKKIMQLQLEKKDLTNAQEIADLNVRTLNGDLRVLRHKYFSEKNSGI